MEKSDNSRGGDPGQLSNYQLSELATNPYVSPEYGKRLDSELERRREAGDFNIERDLDDALQEHAAEMREQTQANMRKRNQRLGADSITNANFEQERFEAQDSRSKARRRANTGHTSKPVNTHTYFNGLRQKNRTSRGVARSESFRISTEEIVGQTIERAEAQLDEHFLDYYTEGAIEALSNGDFRIDPRGFITSSFVSSEKQKFDHLLLEEQRPVFWDSFKYDVMDEKIRKWNNMESVGEAEHGAIMEALRRGASVEKTGMHEVRLKTTLPIAERRLDEFAGNYGVDFESPEVQRASYEGFLNIIDTIKDDSRLLKDGIKALDWYYEKFDYDNQMDDFLDVAYGYANSADTRGRTCLNAYLSSRRIYRDYVAKKRSEHVQERDIEKSEEKSAEGEHGVNPVMIDSLEEVKKQFADFGLTPEDLDEYVRKNLRLITGEILPAESRDKIMEDTDEAREKRHHYPRSFAQEKMRALYLAFYLIKKTVDPDADIIRTYRRGEGGDDNGNNSEQLVTIGSDKYALIRFGCENKRSENENHVIGEGNSPEAATYTWHGEEDDWVDALVARHKMQARRHPNVEVVFHNHSQSVIDHMAQIMAGLGFDLFEMAKEVDKEKEKATPEEAA